jgi:hypothetical protein
MTDSKPSLPTLLAGPILRRTLPGEISFWAVVSKDISHCVIRISQENSDKPVQAKDFLITKEHLVQVSQHCWILLAHYPLEQTLGHHFSYNIIDDTNNKSLLPDHLYYKVETNLSCKVSQDADYIMHGSCRNPHHFSDDSLVAADNKVALQDLPERPDLLMLSGDQIYADHVAGPMLDAISQVITLLDLPKEHFNGAPFERCEQLYAHRHHLYGRQKLLPNYQDHSRWLSKLFDAHHAPIFSSKDCDNHLITFSEFFAMYLLVWSPTLWKCIDLERVEKSGFCINGHSLSQAHRDIWMKEKSHLTKFVEGLPQVQRLLAHIPTYMIFDDHDITDDWNLTVGWEQAAYNHPFANRIIGNGLMAYMLCQGWGNNPSVIGQLFKGTFNDLVAGQFNQEAHNSFITQLIRFEGWHYSLDTTPKMVILDTRTRRWRSESNMNKPSGLMDWEALVEFQQELIGQDAVIVISPAPMFGVKFIEALQRVMTKAGYPLVIDAENWMAHPGSANTLLSIFTHTKTPDNFVILSGDVHYSFAYDIKLRYRKSSPNIYQITCSGLKNQFPEPLLKICDTLDKWLYTPRSPLNWFTKRSKLKITKRKPQPSQHNRLVNHSAIGELRLDSDGKPNTISLLFSNGSQVKFPSR